MQCLLGFPEFRAGLWRSLPHPRLASDQARPLGTADSHAAAMEDQEPDMQELAGPSAEQGEAQTFDKRVTGGAILLGTARFS